MGHIIVFFLYICPQQSIYNVNQGFLQQEMSIF